MKIQSNGVPIDANLRFMMNRYENINWVGVVESAIADRLKKEDSSLFIDIETTPGVNPSISIELLEEIDALLRRHGDILDGIAEDAVVDGPNVQAVLLQEEARRNNDLRLKVVNLIPLPKATAHGSGANTEKAK